MDRDTVIRRIDELISEANRGEHGFRSGLQGAISLVAMVHGPDSPQLKTLSEAAADPNVPRSWGAGFYAELTKSTLTDLRGEVEAGLIGDLRAKITGGVLADFIALAREALDSDASGSVNVAAVLAAAAFEDTIRRMGERFAGVADRPKLDVVLTKLKETGVIEGPQVGIAQSFLSFRNHALHAQWDKIDRASVQSCLSFVQELLLKHFIGG